ncbi:hypothetical protein STRDD11_00550 [Streptococcus sp. DD11]|uniref:zinc-ribbon domain-containing protein n=1 Tax=Streptococcus sp. DD11 TaxID=1777879 RepID=UPI0007939017|nr:zinc-ribbon domain-containing protein [Streptococcus sp. DD11]KXT85143.1 hypothetical protein STRDD11_00550 [Streptococcus sp. DD11]
MGFCTNCGHALAEGAHFCSNCGVAMGKTDAEMSQRKTVYGGELYKCPSCAERLDSFMSSCPSCGYELRGAGARSRVEKLANKLGSTKNKEQKIELIRNFYIPNTKEDIYEFVILATSNMNSYGYDFEAWNTKLEQAYQKATLSFGNTKEFQYISQLYSQAQKRKRLKSFMKTLRSSNKLQFFLSFGGGLTMVWAAGAIEKNIDTSNFFGSIIMFFGRAISMLGTLLFIFSFLIIFLRKKKVSN